MQNAFWEWGPQQATFGDGWADVDDIVGHEFTHGVLDDGARLFYDHQSGALNESFADIFGEVFDLSNGYGQRRVRRPLADRRGPAPAAPCATCRIRVASETPTGSAAHAGTPGPGDSGGVHSNSGVGNKAATLIADGGPLQRSDRRGHRPRAHAAHRVRGHDRAGSPPPPTTSTCMRRCRRRARTSWGRRASPWRTADRCAMRWTPRRWTGCRPPAPHGSPLCASTGRYPVDSFMDDLEHPGAGRWTSVRLR